MRNPAIRALIGRRQMGGGSHSIGARLQSLHKDKNFTVYYTKEKLIFFGKYVW
jgi:hypothetical protein